MSSGVVTVRYKGHISQILYGQTNVDYSEVYYSKRDWQSTKNAKFVPVHENNGLREGLVEKGTKDLCFKTEITTGRIWALAFQKN